MIAKMENNLSDKIKTFWPKCLIKILINWKLRQIRSIRPPPRPRRTSSPWWSIRHHGHPSNSCRNCLRWALSPKVSSNLACRAPRPTINFPIHKSRVRKIIKKIKTSRFSVKTWPNQQLPHKVKIQFATIIIMSRCLPTSTTCPQATSRLTSPAWRP